MNNNFEKGLIAEKRIQQILINKGFKIIGNRIKSRIGEIDILARYKKDYYIIEVKFRQNIINALYSINKPQLNRSLKTFYEYMEKKNLKYEQIYFLAIIMNKKEYKIINITDFEES